MKKACIYGLITAILITLAACGQDTATTIRLAKTEGSVHVSDGSGQDIEPLEDLMIYGGYGIDTASDSYAWMNLDDTKLTKMDEDSAIQIRKTGKNLEIQVDRGGLFFHITEPLTEDESLNIRTSTMTVGIRGTCGWVVVPDPEHMILYLLEGTAECAAGENTAAVTAWQMAVMTADSEITVTEFSQEDIPGFVWVELVKNTALAQAADHRHIWVYATCESAKYCVVCEETEGEPLDHEWIEATCLSPKTCKVCKTTEGDTLPHEFTEATYQSPATCKVCGISDGEMLQGDFDQHGLICNVELDKEYPYTTLTYRNKDIYVNGTVLFSNYRIFESDEEHEGIEGYEWKSVDVTFTYNDDNAWDYGTTSSPFTTDFYHIEPKNESGPNKNESDVGIVDNNDTYTVNFNGIDYTECLNEDHALVMEWNNRVYTCKIQFSFRVPIGYDGSIVGAISDGQFNDGDYIYEVADENTLFFRLK